MNVNSLLPPTSVSTGLAPESHPSVDHVGHPAIVHNQPAPRVPRAIQESRISVALRVSSPARAQLLKEALEALRVAGSRKGPTCGGGQVDS